MKKQMIILRKIGNWLTGVIRPHEDFLEETKRYNKVDVRLAWIVYAIVFLILWVQVVYHEFLSNFFELLPQNIFNVFLVNLINGIFPGIVIGMVFLVCKIRKQGILRFSFNKKLTAQSLVGGFVLGVVVIFWRGGLIGIRDDLNVTVLISSILMYLIYVAFMEELLIQNFFHNTCWCNVCIASCASPHN